MIAPAAVIQMVEAEASKIGVDPYIALGIISVESQFLPNAVHWDQYFTEFYYADKFAKAAHIDTKTEQVFQSVSYGYFQLEGATLRGMGFTAFIPSAVDPQTNIHWGIKFLKSLMVRFKNVNDQISVYNWGHIEKNPDGAYKNQKYVDAVLAAVAEIKKQILGDTSVMLID